MTIKYSPRLKRQWGNWYAADQLFLCGGGVTENWEVRSFHTCWVALSDAPVQGAMRITLNYWALTAHHATFPERFVSTSRLRTFLQQFGEDRDVWLWIEVPA